MMRYRVERRLASKPASFADFYEERADDEWALVTVAETRRHPAAIGFVGSTYGEQIRVVCGSKIVDVYEWVERIPVNPGDIHCTDFVPGWKLVMRHNPPTPSADELAHFFMVE